MFGFSIGHLIILLVIILLFGGRRIPELGGSIGKGLRAFKRGIEGLEDETKKSLEDPNADSTAKKDDANNSDKS